MYESFNQCCIGPNLFPYNSPWPTPTQPPPPLSLINLLSVSEADAIPVEKRQAIVSWLQDNIVPLIGPGAAGTLGEILNGAANNNNFCKQVLDFQKHLARGIQTPDTAVDDWRKTQKNL